MKLPQISPRRDFFKTNIHTQINDIILTLEECIFTPYSSQRRAVSSKLRSASAGDWPLKIKLNNFVNRSIETVPEIKIMHSSYEYYIDANTTTSRSNISQWFLGAVPLIFFKTCNF